MKYKKQIQLDSFFLGIFDGISLFKTNTSKEHTKKLTSFSKFDNGFLEDKYNLTNDRENYMQDVSKSFYTLRNEQF